MNVTRLLVIAGFLAGLLLIGVVEVLAHREKSRIPTLADLFGFIMSYRAGRVPVGRIGVYGFWWWLGWHFLAR